MHLEDVMQHLMTEWPVQEPVHSMVGVKVASYEDLSSDGCSRSHPWH